MSTSMATGSEVPNNPVVDYRLKPWALLSRLTSILPHPIVSYLDIEHKFRHYHPLDYCLKCYKTLLN